MWGDSAKIQDFETSIQNIDLIEFLEDCLGIKLLAYQKEILRRMQSEVKMTDENALEALINLYNDIDKDNHL